MAAMPSHDMSQMTHQTMSQSSIHSECVTAEHDSNQADDCCQTDSCKKSCSSGVSMMFDSGKHTLIFVEARHYMGFTHHAYAHFDDTSNPPPIS